MNGEFEMINEEKRMTEVKAELKKYWNYERNAPLLPEEVKLNSNRVVWLKCPSGHDFTVRIRNFMLGARCPYDCGLWIGRSGLSVKFPELEKEFDTEKNGFRPDEIEYNSQMPVWWKCLNGHSYKMPVSKRTRRKGCPCCEGNE